MISARKITLLGISALVMVALLGTFNQVRAAENTVKVFILAGQSNMEGKARNTLLEHQATDPKTKDSFAHLRDGDKWAVRDDVFIKFLKRKGLKTLTRNFTCKTGEIDLIMVDADRAIVFVEVKTRANESFGPAESAITSGKKAKMTRTARYFLATNEIEDRPLRFDVVTVILGQKGPVQIRHYENAFVP